ncbi:hypothetical protein SEVIR_1G189200v4 [Setaria viridis]|uniref:Uncharacterized protein n=1 Tax=Setaria viridis TaxID=4556 RepID=A0A4U6WER4_SETVI|nr:hypothetical protein SEVIR_1G189200v2 [Setaria viridis]
MIATAAGGPLALLLAGAQLRYSIFLDSLIRRQAELVHYQLVLTRALKPASSETLACDTGEAQHVLDEMLKKAGVTGSPPPCIFQCAMYYRIVILYYGLQR